MKNLSMVPIAAWVSLAISCGTAAAAKDARPNVILIMTDDRDPAQA